MTEDELRLIETRARPYLSKMHMAGPARRQRALDEQALIAEVRRLRGLTSVRPANMREAVEENARKVHEKAAAIIAQYGRKP